MSVVKYSKNKALKAQRSAGIKSVKLDAGTKLVVDSIITNPSSDENLNRDELLCIKPDGKRLRVPIREFMNMTVADGGKLYKDAEEDGDVVFPLEFTITAAEDRMTSRFGEEQPIYPIQAYNAGAEQIQSRNFDFEALLKSGLKADNTLEPVQNYTISASF
jgi:DNA gyrase/topoisomerase IV subunit A